MTTMISEACEAFKEANVSDATGRKAAKAVAPHDTRFANTGFKMEQPDGRVTLVIKAFA